DERLQSHACEVSFKSEARLTELPCPSILSRVQKRRIMGPFQTPWPTFFAWIVIGGTILMAIVWSIVGFRKGEDR
ncbi:hypothetical protein KAJ02_07960, partial [Candidatus Bipolaricaulota bacterium]|nr:hypothetical protein [Candidatus Bipolaricaulota bacterium]